MGKNIARLYDHSADAGLEILEVSDVTGEGAGGGKDYWVAPAK